MEECVSFLSALITFFLDSQSVAYRSQWLFEESENLSSSVIATFHFLMIILDLPYKSINA